MGQKCSNPASGGNDSTGNTSMRQKNTTKHPLYCLMYSFRHSGVLHSGFVLHLVIIARIQPRHIFRRVTQELAAGTTDFIEFQGQVYMMSKKIN